MPTKAKMIQRLMIAVVAAIAFQHAGAQSRQATANARTGDKPGSASDDNFDRAKTLRAAADALGMVRWSDIGAGGVHLPAVDVLNTMEFWGSGITYGSGQAYKSDASWPSFKTEYHVALAYNPPAMRVEMTRTNPDAPVQGSAAPLHTIQVVRDKYAWNESEMGAGLVLGKGTATAAMAAAVNNRLLQLWILPYGVVKAALAA